MSDKNSGPNLVRIHSDAHAADKVRFGFKGYADTLAGLIANPKNETPLVIGIYGSWGSGKTTLMRAMQERLDGGGLHNCPKAWVRLLRRCDPAKRSGSRLGNTTRRARSWRSFGDYFPDHGQG